MIIQKLKAYFDISELVCPDVYKRFGDRAWQFFDPRILENLLFIRQSIAHKIVVNTWKTGGRYTQRGLRCNLCSLVADKTKSRQLYVSAHQQGMAVDFDIEGMTAEGVRAWIKQHKESIPHACRLEDGTTWVHMDSRINPLIDAKIQIFKP